MSSKSVEVYYDIADIPGISDRGDWSGEALTFRDRAMEHIEAAMTAAGAGEWEGADIGLGAVNFGFSVEDFDRAEAVIRSAVAGTEFECIRDITRFEMSEADLAEAAAAPAPGKLPFRIKMMLALTMPVALLVMLFRIVTLPLKGAFRQR